MWAAHLILVCACTFHFGQLIERALIILGTHIAQNYVQIFSKPLRTPSFKVAKKFVYYLAHTLVKGVIINYKQNSVQTNLT